jgi:hypothetical protein
MPSQQTHEPGEEQAFRAISIMVRQQRSASGCADDESARGKPSDVTDCPPMVQLVTLLHLAT